MAVPWRENEDDATMNLERLKGEVVMTRSNKEQLEMEEHVSVPRRVYITREDLEAFGVTARCPQCLSLLKEAARQAHTENCRKRFEEELRGTKRVEAAQSRVKEHQDKAAERGAKRTKTNLEEGLAQRERGGTTVQMEEDAPITKTSLSSGSSAAAASSSSSSGTGTGIEFKQQ